jgi:hypothetical protein
MHSPRSGFARARKTLRVSTTATTAQIPAISSIGAVLSTRKFQRIVGFEWSI